MKILYQLPNKSLILILNYEEQLNHTKDIILCFYAGNVKITRCTKHGEINIQMLGKKAKPKNRYVCVECKDYLINSSLAVIKD